jgi:hypothetical protein
MTAKDCTARIQFLKELHMSSASGLYSSTYKMHIRAYYPFVLQPKCEAPSSLQCWNHPIYLHVFLAQENSFTLYSEKDFEAFKQCRPLPSYSITKKPDISYTV